MCYQISLAYDKMALAHHYQIPFPEEQEWQAVYFESGFSFPSWPVLHHYPEPRFDLMQWGLIPNWTANTQKAHELRPYTLNAKSETALEKPSFKTAMKSSPVVIPVGGFFENRHEGKLRIPYFLLGKEEKILSLAGISDEWIDKESGEVIRSFSILTCAAEGVMAYVHNSKLRSPVILKPGTWRDWLNSEIDAKERLKLASLSDEILQARRIRPDFNKQKTDRNRAEFLKEWKEPESPAELF